MSLTTGRSLKRGLEIEDTGLTVPVNMGRRTVMARVLLGHEHGVPFYFIRRDEYFDREYLYGTPEGDYFDNLERFTFFSRAVLEVIKARRLSPDIIHCNDWQTGLIPAYLKDIYREEPVFLQDRDSPQYPQHRLSRAVPGQLL